MSGYVGRLAPSPTGALHLGNVRTFMIAWLRARGLGGKVILRTEDLDHPKDKPGAAVQAIEDLRWLGFDWDEEYVQSERKPIYREALEALHARGLVYPCVCTRKDVEAAQSAPHAGEQLHYPGTCRDRFGTWQEALEFKHRVTESRSQGASPCLCASVFKPCWRFRVPDDTVVSFDDVFAGRYEQNVSRTLGDFPLAREEFGAGYTLACTVDDLLMGVTEVVRGDDLLPATPAQILLARALRSVFNFQSSVFSFPPSTSHFPPSTSHFPPSTSHFPPSTSHFPFSTSHFPFSTSHFPFPAYLHVPLVVGKDGKRLAKRHGDTRVATYRQEGRSPEEILGFLAASCGWAGEKERVSLGDLLGRFDLGTIPRAPFMI